MFESETNSQEKEDELQLPTSGCIRIVTILFLVFDNFKSHRCYIVCTFIQMLRQL